MRQNRQFSRLRHHLPPTPRPRIRRPQVQRLRQSLNESQSLQSLAQTLAVVLTRLGSGIAPSPRNERKIRILPTELRWFWLQVLETVLGQEGLDVVAGLFPDSEVVRARQQLLRPNQEALQPHRWDRLQPIPSRSRVVKKCKEGGGHTISNCVNQRAVANSIFVKSGVSFCYSFRECMDGKNMPVI